MSLTFYKVNTISIKAEPVDVESHSEAFVVIKMKNGENRRFGKNNSYEKYFPSKKEAFIYLITKHREAVYFCKTRLNDAEKKLILLETEILTELGEKL